jgi:1-deoxy-D-xylulose-5-phosphate synthase
MSEQYPHSPEELRGLSLQSLEHLAADVRQQILAACMKNGGHLGASLGAVELAIALHRVFESPVEPIVWDVGHQAYAHKLLTGRWERFQTLRMTGGISGFLSRDESKHDVFGAGHSSTALSAALAMAWAHGHAKSERWTVAVVGDGGLTAGLALEALDNIHATDLGPLLVVLNDNQMSISPNVGAIPKILAEGKAAEFFAHFELDYAGPVDGHNLHALLGTLEGIRKNYAGRPVLLHVLTQKGKGYVPAEEQPAVYHGISPVQSKVPGAAQSAKQKTYSDAFGEAICRLAEKDRKIVAITAAMPEGTGLTEFARRFPDRFFDVGIAEPHAVTFAAGLATQGYKPVVAIYSTFLQRALDSIIHDTALQRLGVTFAIDRAGIVGADGPTHHGAFDLAYLGMIPGVVLAAPACLDDVETLLEQGVNSGKPFALRYPRGSGPKSFEPVPKHGVRWFTSPPSPHLIAVAVGACTERLKKAVEALDAKHQTIALVSVALAKPLAPELMKYFQEQEAPIVLVEDGVIHGGIGQSVAGQLASSRAKVFCVGYGDHFITHGSVSDLEKLEGLSADALKSRLEKVLAET